MVEYKNREYLKSTIMDQSRHQFIYCYDNEQRKELLQELNIEYISKVNSNTPISVYLNEFGLPKKPICDDIDKFKIDIIAREYLAFKIAYEILLKIKTYVDINLFSENIKRLLGYVNRCFLNTDFEKINSLEDLIKSIEESIEFYMTYYLEYVKSGKEIKSISEVRIPFLQLEIFISQFKRILNCKSYFGILLDKDSDISISSMKAVNSLISARINSDLSIKVLVEPDKWETFFNLTGEVIESVHDYGIIEVDDSLNQYIRKRRNK